MLFFAGFKELGSKLCQQRTQKSSAFGGLTSAHFSADGCGQHSVGLTFLCHTQAGGSFIPPMQGELKQHTVLSLTEPTALAGDYLYF